MQLLRRLVAALAAHPLRVTGAVGLVTAVLNSVWVREGRFLGAYNVDEVGYMAAGLRFQRALDLARPLEFAKAVGAPSPTGPLVPLLTVPLTTVFGRGVPVLMLVQALMIVVAAVATAGITLRLADRHAALVAGLVTLALPGLVQSARGFQYASAAAATLGVAVWALLGSDRGHRRIAMLAFGIAVGLMLLSRTMAVGFIPGLAVAAMVVVRRERRALHNLALAAVAAGVVAAPWWITSRAALFDYLFGFGYGSTSKYYGQAGLFDRIDKRWANLADDLRAFRWVGVVLALAVVATVLWDRRRGSAGGSWPWRRGALAVAAVVLLSYGALLTTRNQGVWFELPVEVLGVALALSGLARLRPTARGAISGLAVAVALATFVISMTDPGGDLGAPGTARSARVGIQQALYGGLIDKQRPLGDADARLMSNDPSVREAAADDWWHANVAVANFIEERRVEANDRLILTVSGSSHLINNQTLLLTEELRSLPPPPTEVPDTAGPTADLLPFLEPRWRGTHDRMLVLIRSRSLPFPEERQVPRLQRLAEDRGWEETGRLPLPDGGDVVFLTPAAR